MTKIFKIISQILVAIVAVIIAVAGSAAPTLAQGETPGVLTVRQISEHVYRWGDGTQYGAYVATDEGAIVVDGHYCHTTLPHQLKEHITTTHGVEVKYVILSHDHQDHVCNTGVYADTAIAVAHRNILPHLVREGRNTLMPTVTFDTEMDIVLGGITVTLLYLGPSHSDNLIQIHIPAEKVLISIDTAKGRSLFPDYRDMDVHGMLKVQRALAYLPDVDVVLPGHGPIRDQRSFLDQYAYMKALHDTVLERMVAGETLDVMRETIKLGEFRDYGGFDNWIDQNIVTMYHFLYRYREPNRPITWDDAVECYTTTTCRTSNE